MLRAKHTPHREGLVHISHAGQHPFRCCTRLVAAALYRVLGMSVLTTVLYSVTAKQDSAHGETRAGSCKW